MDTISSIEAENTNQQIPSPEESFVVDYFQLSRKELFNELKELAKDDSFKRSDVIYKKIRQAFDVQLETEKEEALQRFLSEGGAKDDFDYRVDDVSKSFIDLSQTYQKRLKAHYEQLESQKTQNLASKKELLETLRGILSGEENIASFKKVKDIQEKWKQIGPVPQAENNELWANYKALIDRFYSNRGILNDLIELDRKKNLTAKIALCERAEALINELNIRKMIDQLQDIHEEFRTVGPVSKEDSDQIWNRLKVASEALYQKREQFREEQKTQFEQNALIKKQLLQELEALSLQSGTTHAEWEQLTLQLQQLQARWQNAGMIPTELLKEYNRLYWQHVKQFFAQKSVYYKILDAERSDNLAKKVALCEQVEALMNSSDFDSTSKKIIRLQQDWKQIGQAPRHQNEKIFNRFRKACNTFFDRKKEHHQSALNQEVENLSLKKDLLLQIKSLKNDDIAGFKQLVAQWYTVGYVPKDNAQEIKKEFSVACSSFIDTLKNVDEQSKLILSLECEYASVAQTPDASSWAKRKAQDIKRKIGDFQREIDTLNRNVEFFRTSKNIASIQEEVNKNVLEIQKKIDLLKEQQKVVDKVGSL